jgi:hypothetical protein
MERGTGRGLALALLLLFPALVCAEDGAALKLSDGSTQVVVDNAYESVLSVDASERELEATLISFGKANPLSGDLLDRLQTKDEKLYRKAKKIRSAFEIAQGDDKFYVRGFTTIRLSKLEPGRPVKCRIVLLKVRTGKGVSYIPLIRSIQLL